MSDSPLFSPELEGLLREAAADPRSVLLRVPQSTPLRVLSVRQEPMSSVAMAGTSLDRHLLAVYRDELVELLHGACLVRLYSDDSVSLNVHSSKSVGADWRARSPREWVIATKAQLERSQDELRSLGGFELLMEACRDHRFEEVSITQLARTALRLRSSAKSQAWVALDQRLHGMFGLSERIAGAILSEHVAPSLAASVLENRASCRASLGDYSGAAFDARGAFEEDETKVSALVNWMHYAIMAGDKEQARFAGSLLDSSTPAPTPGLLRQLRTFGELRRVGLTKFEEYMRQTAQTLTDHVGPLAKKVIDVYL